MTTRVSVRIRECFSKSQKKKEVTVGRAVPDEDIFNPNFNIFRKFKSATARTCPNFGHVYFPIIWNVFMSENFDNLTCCDALIAIFTFFLNPKIGKNVPSLPIGRPHLYDVQQDTVSMDRKELSVVRS